MRSINVLWNWNNKLNNVVFTHICKGGYPIAENTVIEVKERGKRICFAKVIRAIYCEFSEINPLILMLDCGKDEAETNDYFKTLGFDSNSKVDKAQLYVLMRTNAPAPDALFLKLFED